MPHFKTFINIDIAEVAQRQHHIGLMPWQQVLIFEDVDHPGDASWYVYTLFILPQFMAHVHDLRSYLLYVNQAIAQAVLHLVRNGRFLHKPCARSAQHRCIECVYGLVLVAFHAQTFLSSDSTLPHQSVADLVDLLTRLYLELA